MRRICFIINPISGVGRQSVVEDLIVQHLDSKDFETEVKYTKAAGHATELSREAAEQGMDAVIVVGGDGSVNEAALGLIHHKHCALGIIPTGSGNGLARHLGLPIDLTKAVQLLNHSKIRTIDTALMNDRLFVGTAGIGFDAHIGFKFAEFGTRGFSSYARLVLREFPTYGSRHYTLEIDGKQLELDAFVIAFANSSQYGNNAMVSPNSRLDDGILEVCILKDCPKWRIPEMLIRLFRGTLEASKYVEILPAKEIRLKQSDSTAHLDGEPVKLGQELHIQVQPASLKVLVGASALS